MKQRFCFLLALVCLFWAEPGHAAMHLKSAILVNLGSGKILYERNADTPLPPASLTKIMTIFLTMDAIKAKKIHLNQRITISSTAARTGGSAMRLSAGEKVPVVRLLAGMSVSSGNDAAMAIAEKIGGSVQKFVAQMNAKARQLGMSKTQFKNPTGLPAPGHKSTARDLMKLCRIYLRVHPQATRFHSMTYFVHKGAVARNTNSLLGRVKGVDGLKTGWTIASGYNLIVTAKRGKTRMLAIVLGCTSKEARDAAAIKLLDSGFAAPNNPAKVKKLING